MLGKHTQERDLEGKRRLAFLSNVEKQADLPSYMALTLYPSWECGEGKVHRLRGSLIIPISLEVGPMSR